MILTVLAVAYLAIGTSHSKAFRAPWLLAKVEAPPIWVCMLIWPAFMIQRYAQGEHHKFNLKGEQILSLPEKEKLLDQEIAELRELIYTPEELELHGWAKPKAIANAPRCNHCGELLWWIRETNYYACFTCQHEYLIKIHAQHTAHDQKCGCSVCGSIQTN